MLKQVISLAGLICVFGLSARPQASLASESTVSHSKTASPVATKQDLYTASPVATDQALYNVFTRPNLKISLSHRQVTLYHGILQSRIYPIAIGRAGWETPIGHFQVLQMLHNPTWIHPFTGESIAGGDPENPLGHYWIGFWTNGKNWIGFHGTPTPQSVGKPASHGCIRMYNKDVEELFRQVSPGTPVVVVK